MAKIKERIKDLVPYWIITVLILYVFPLLITGTGMAILMLMILIPASLFICSVLYSIRHSPSLWYVLSVPVLFAPTVFLYYGWDGDMGIVYGTGYTVIVLLGYAMGRIIYRKSRLQETPEDVWQP